MPNMSTHKTTTAPPEEEPLVDAPEGVDLAALKQRFGVESAPRARTAMLAIDALVLPEDLPRGAGAFSANFELVGVLHPLCVVDESTPDGQRYRVVTGRRRLRDAKTAELKYIECHVYEALTPEQEALVVLSENARRSNAWVEETTQLRRLIGRTGLTVRELAKVLGISHGTAQNRLALALLPDALWDAIVADHASHGLAQKVAALKPDQQQQVIAALSGGETLSLDLVRATLKRAQAPLSNALGAALEAMPEGRDGEDEDATHPQDDLIALRAMEPRLALHSPRAAALARALVLTLEQER